MPKPDWELRVVGEPKAWARNRVTPGTGRIFNVKTPWYHQVLRSAAATRPGRPLEGNLALSLIFNMPFSAIARKEKRTWFARTPDWDNLGKAISDALEKAGVVSNDSRFVQVLVQKQYSERPGVFIQIGLASTQLRKLWG